MFKNTCTLSIKNSYAAKTCLSLESKLNYFMGSHTRFGGVSAVTIGFRFAYPTSMFFSPKRNRKNIYFVLFPASLPRKDLPNSVTNATGHVLCCTFRIHRIHLGWFNKFETSPSFTLPMVLLNWRASTETYTGLVFSKWKIRVLISDGRNSISSRILHLFRFFNKIFAKDTYYSRCNNYNVN